MKTIKKVLTSLTVALLLGTTALSNVSFASGIVQEIPEPYCTTQTPVETEYVSSLTYDITPKSDIIEWRYKSINGKLYRRLYNYSRMEWIGEWELCE